jgi:hypothetical protein
MVLRSIGLNPVEFPEHFACPGVKYTAFPLDNHDLTGTLKVTRTGMPNMMRYGFARTAQTCCP